MKLIDAVNEYIAYKRGLGIRFNTDARILMALCRVMGTATRLESLNETKLNSFLVGARSPTVFRNREHYALVGFNRFVVGRGYSASLPLPKMPPTKTRTFVPYVLSREELRRLLDAIPRRRAGRLLQPLTLRTVLLLLYGAALRISEATSLNLGDANLEDAIITVRETKFYKTRLVPLGPQLNQIMKVYADWRAKEGHDQHPKAPFFVLSSGACTNHVIVRGAFQRLREFAQIHHPDGQRPRLHDLRHSAAVHRLVAWYRQGANVQMLLPKLAVYMGHVRLSSTQIYLTMTPELLREVSLRFQKYAMSEVSHE
jgi:integrase/recombinase XerD